MYCASPVILKLYSHWV